MVAAIALSAGGCATGTGSARGDSHPVATAPSVGMVTQVLTFQAFDDRGLLPGLAAARSVSGVCTGGSLLVAGRADAWRCSADATEFDPCFSAEGSAQLACVPDPFTSDVTILQVTGPLPRGNRNDPGHQAWFLELVDGSRCGPVAPAVAVVARASPTTYACTGGRAVFGDPDGSRPVWIALVGPESGGAAPAPVEVKVAWY